VWPVAGSGLTFVSTFEGATHKMSGGEGYMKDLLGLEDAKMLVDFTVFHL
jgi:hypothetical protein